MADNLELNAGSGGATLAADDVAGVHYQVVKIDVGGDGASAPLSTSNPIPISDAGGSVTVDGTVAVSGTVAVTDNSGSLTVDAPVGTPVFVRLSDGTDPIATLPVSLASVPSHAVTNAGTFAVQAAQSGTWNIGTVTAVTAISNALPAGTNNIGDVDVLSLPAIPAGNNNIGDVDIASIAAGDNNIGNVDVVTVPTDPFGANADAASATGSISAKLRFIASTGIPITGTVTVGSHAVTNAGTFAVQNTAATSGGSTPYKNLDVDETEDDIKTSAGQLFWIHVMNLSASVRYIKFYNATAANVTVGTTTPVLSFPVPTMADTNGAGFCVNFGDTGLAFSTAICVAATTGLADNNTGAPGANEVVLNAGYA